MRSEFKRKRLPGAARRQAIRDGSTRSASLSICEISRKLGVSEMTIRRDLATLEKSSDVRRTHGGAVVAERMVFEFSYAVRQRERIKEKQGIAAAARQLVEPGQRVLLDTDATTLQLAALPKDFDIFITDRGIAPEHLRLARKMAGKALITQPDKQQIKQQTKHP